MIIKKSRFIDRDFYLYKEFDHYLLIICLASMLNVA